MQVLAPARQHRPLWTSSQLIHTLYASGKPIYQHHNVVVEGSNYCNA